MARHTTASALALLVATGCYASHQLDREHDGGAGDATTAPADDAGTQCVTSCAPPAVLARIELGVGMESAPAVLDMVVHRDEIVAALLLSRSYASPLLEPEAPFVLARISRRTGDVRLEAIDRLADTLSIAAGALASDGESLTFVAVHGEVPAIPGGGPLVDVQPVVSIVRWTAPAAPPRIDAVRLTEARVPHCPGCRRRGASVAISDRDAIVSLAGEHVLHVARVGLTTGALAREDLSMTSVTGGTAIAANADARGRALLTFGGVRDIVGAIDGPAFALSADLSRLGEPVSVPGAPTDPVPHPFVHDGALEVVRFLHETGRFAGALHRFSLTPDGAVEISRIATAGDLPPIAIASTGSTLMWAESSLAPIGEADLRVLVVGGACEAALPSTAVHVPSGVGSVDPRALEVTEADGRTLAAVIEEEGFVATYRAFLTVIDLGECGASRSTSAR